MKYNPRYFEISAFLIFLAGCASTTNMQNLTQIRSDAQQLYEQGQYQRAAQLWEEELKIEEGRYSSDSLVLLDVLNNLGGVYIHLAKYSQAESTYKRGIAILEKANHQNDLWMSQFEGSLGKLYNLQKRYAEAEPLILKALELRENTLGPENPEVASLLALLGTLYGHMGKYGEAESALKKSLAILENEPRLVKADVLNYAKALNNLGEVYRYQPEFNFEVQHVMGKASAIMRRDAQTIPAVEPRGTRLSVGVQGPRKIRA